MLLLPVALAFAFVVTRSITCLSVHPRACKEVLFASRALQYHLSLYKQHTCSAKRLNLQRPVTSKLPRRTCMAMAGRLNSTYKDPNELARIVQEMPLFKDCLGFDWSQLKRNTQIFYWLPTPRHPRTSITSLGLDKMISKIKEWHEGKQDADTIANTETAVINKFLAIQGYKVSV